MVAAAIKDGFFSHLKNAFPGVDSPPTERDDLTLNHAPDHVKWNQSAPPNRPDGAPDLNALRDRVAYAVRERDRAKVQADAAMEAFERYAEIATIAFADFEQAVERVRRMAADDVKRAEE